MDGRTSGMPPGRIPKEDQPPTGGAVGFRRRVDSGGCQHLRLWQSNPHSGVTFGEMQWVDVGVPVIPCSCTLWSSLVNGSVASWCGGLAVLVHQTTESSPLGERAGKYPIWGLHCPLWGTYDLKVCAWLEQPAWPEPKQCFVIGLLWNSQS